MAAYILPDSASAVRYQGILRSESAVYTAYFSFIILLISHVNVHKTHMRCQKTLCIFTRVKSMYIDPTKLHFTATNFSQNILVITSPAEPSRSHSCNQKMGAYILPDSASAVRYQGILRSESAVLTVYFSVIILLISHVNVHNRHMRCQKNTLYFRPSQEHVYRPHQTAFHCHQLFPKHFGNREPSRAQPITLLQPKNGCIYFAR